jgi:polysaccharide biosynthesis protein PslH
VNILIICPLLPFPLTNGGMKSVYYPIKVLAERGHRVHLACLSRGIDPEAVREVERYCTVDIVECASRPTVTGALKSALSSTPYDIARYSSHGLQEKIFELLEREHVDVIQAEGIHSAPFALAARERFGTPILLRVNTIQHVNLLRAVGKYPNPFLNAYLWFEGRKVRSYEISEGRKFDLNLVISDHDGDVLRRLDPALNCMTIPAGVELAEFDIGTEQPDPATVLWMGALNWQPNRDSFWWFYREIVPHLVRLVPHVRIQVVGSEPPEDILNVRHPNMEILGFVPDLRDVVRHATVSVVPLQVGSGIRIKLLELFAMRRAVVCTSVGAEGLHLEDGVQLLIADAPLAFAEAVQRLIRDPALRARLGSAGWQHVERSYTWARMGALYEEAYRRVLADRSAPPVQDGR